jgi:sulfofructose kinase
MVNVLCAGLASMDFIFRVGEMPTRPEKYRAKDAAQSTGGGAAGQALAATRLGGQGFAVTRLGDDPMGALVVDGMAANGIDCRFARRFDGRRSSYSSILIDAAGERQIVNYRDWDLPADAGWLLDADHPEIAATVADTRWPEGAAALMRLARERGVPGIMDGEAPARDAVEALRLASHIAFSIQGLRDLAGEEDARDGLLAARKEFDAWLCVTDGENGVTWLDDGEFGHVPAVAVDVVDTLGAGDIWHGAFALALGEGQETATAIRFANAAASIKCSRFGGQSGCPDRQEVEAFLQLQEG